MKHIWQYYDRLDYRALAQKLDEMAREGWQLKRVGILGLTFEPCSPKTVYHRVIRSPQLSGEAIPEGWTALLRSGERTILTRDYPLTEAEKLAEDGEMDYWYRWQKNVAFCWFTIMLIFLWKQLRMWDQGINSLEGLLMGTMLAGWILVMAESLIWLGNAMAYKRAKHEERLYKPVIKWRGLRMIGWLALIICAVAAVLSMVGLMFFIN